MRMTRRTGKGLLVGALVAVVVAGAVAYGAAVRLLQAKVVEALGQGSETGAIGVGLAGVVVEGLRVPAPSGWPAPDALRAARVTVAPSFASFFSGDEIRVRSIEIEAPYLSALRRGDGKLVALPGVIGDTGTKSASAGEPLAVALGKIEIDAGVLELFDATVARPPLRVRIEQIDATLHHVSVPGLRGKSTFAFDGVVKGAERDGHAHLDGWAELGSRDSSVRIELRGVDLVPLAPYLVRPGEASVRRGSVDLDMQSNVTGAQLAARGTITISDLELASAKGLKNTFLGVSNGVVLAGMKDHGGKLTLDFTLAGDIDHPDFSLNEALGTKLAVSMAETLGVSVGGLVKGVGSLGTKSGEALGEAAKGVGGAISDLFKRDSKD
jgi:hypothetical protein